MMRSVSTFSRSSGAVQAFVSGECLHDAPLPAERTDVDEMAGDGGGRRHGGADQVGAPALPLPALEIAVRGRGAALARLRAGRRSSPEHMEQPGSRHSKPASMKILSSPSRSACCLTRPEPGTTIASLTLEATRLPRATAAAARRSSMRELVQEPMKTLSTRMSVDGRVGLQAHVLPARVPCRCGARRPSRDRGPARAPSTGSTISGEVPQVTCGLMLRASISTTRVELARRHRCAACVQ